MLAIPGRILALGQPAPFRHAAQRQITPAVPSAPARCAGMASMLTTRSRLAISAAVSSSASARSRLRRARVRCGRRRRPRRSARCPAASAARSAARRECRRAAAKAASGVCDSERGALPGDADLEALRPQSLAQAFERVQARRQDRAPVPGWNSASSAASAWSTSAAASAPGAGRRQARPTEVIDFLDTGQRCAAAAPASRAP